MPLETRGVLADYDAGTGCLTVWSSTQWPHTLRDALRDLLGLAEHRIRVVAPDVGGGFGVKQEVYPEEVTLALLAMRLRLPVKWIETRREHVISTAHAREQWHDIELAARRDGTILAMRAELLADIGAYTRSLGVLCPSITAASLPGPYRIKHYTCRVRAALTCKAPAAAYRGAGQPEAVFATERAVDPLARELGMDPAGLRRKNVIGRAAARAGHRHRARSDRRRRARAGTAPRRRASRRHRDDPVRRRHLREPQRRGGRQRGVRGRADGGRESAAARRAPSRGRRGGP